MQMTESIMRRKRLASPLVSCLPSVSHTPVTASPLPITAMATNVRSQATLLAIIIAVVVIVRRVGSRVRPVLPAMRPTRIALALAARPAVPAARNRGVVLVGPVVARGARATP